MITWKANYAAAKFDFAKAFGPLDIQDVASDGSDVYGFTPDTLIFCYGADGQPYAEIKVMTYSSQLLGTITGQITGLSDAAFAADGSDSFARFLFQGDDRLVGSKGADILRGYQGSDTISGGDGRDLLVGANGADHLKGGHGADQFYFHALADSAAQLAGRDEIADFHHADHDKIDLVDIDANRKLHGNEDFHFIGDRRFSHHPGELRFDYAGAKTLVFGDTDGDGKADFSIELAHHLTLSATDFLL